MLYREIIAVFSEIQAKHKCIVDRTQNFWMLKMVVFLSFRLLIGWQLSICNCCKPFFLLLCDCQLLFLWRLALSILVEIYPLPFFPDIAPSRIFTTNSLCLIVCPIHEWRILCKIFQSHLSSFVLWKTSPFVSLSAHFIFNILLHHHVSNAFTTLSSFFPRVQVADP